MATLEFQFVVQPARRTSLMIGVLSPLHLKPLGGFRLSGFCPDETAYSSQNRENGKASAFLYCIVFIGCDWFPLVGVCFDFALLTEGCRFESYLRSHSFPVVPKTS